MADESKKPTEGKKERAGYVKAKTLADLFEVSPARITQLTDDGVLRRYTLDIGKRYNLVESVRGYVRFLRESSRQRAESPLVDEKLDVEIRLKRAKAQRAEIELKELSGKVYRWEDVRDVMNGYVFEVRSMLMSLPGRLAREVAREMSAEEASVLIRAEVNEVLGGLTHFEFDPEIYRQRIRERNGTVQDEEDDE